MIRQAVGGFVWWGEKLLLIEKVELSDTLSNKKDNIKSEWDIPKGGVKTSDTNLERALLRELEEETGSVAYSIQFKYPEQLTFTFPKSVQEKIGFISQSTNLFHVNYIGDGTDLIPNDSEIRQVMFVPVEEALNKLTHAETKKFITNIIL
ncbi:NUDIX hydrolase [Bacillus horti]|uniref:(Di)nucleoside polyphosphate hydrolase n=1 Tax=Caldalkalibacillus horti TaxID=77523 RepID=A0ABT9VW99_9BACI|nr:NUDIX hydrolase [Bacillus horti]MDQ0165271.1 putative (di)nucleoside polyphosphate hydrolase [Bacillus horti]